MIPFDSMEAMRSGVYASTDWSYIAGMIDGDGSIYFNSPSKKSWYCPRLDISSIYKPTIEWLANKFIEVRIWRYMCERIQTGRKHPTWIVQTGGRKAFKTLIPLLEPFLKTKQQHIQVVKQFIQLREKDKPIVLTRNQKGQIQTTRFPYNQKELELVQTLKKLNEMI